MGTRWAVALAGATVVLASCVGSVSRGELDAEVRSRGGGIGQDAVLDAVDALEAELGVDALELRTLTVSPGQVQLQVRVPGTAGDVDGYAYGTSGLYGGRGLSGPDPVAVPAVEEPLETQLFRPDEAGIQHLDAMVDAARDEAGLTGGYAQGVQVRRASGEPRTSVTVRNERATVTVAFAADGSLIEVMPS